MISQVAFLLEMPEGSGQVPSVAVDVGIIGLVEVVPIHHRQPMVLGQVPGPFHFPVPRGPSGAAKWLM